MGRRHAAACVLALAGLAQASVAFAWGQRDDERNRVRAWTRMQNDTANFERYRDRQAARSQSSGSSATRSSAPVSSGSTPAPAYNALGALASTLGALQERSQQPQPAAAATPRESYEEARARLMRDAAQGDVEAAVWAGKALYAGFGGARNDAEALRYFRLAAEKGHPEAQYQTGYMTMYGYGTAANPAEAVQWYRKAADAGEMRGELGYAMALLTGQGVARDEAAALPIMQKLANRRLPSNADADMREAQALMAGLLGDFYLSGTGVKADANEAVRWFSIAAQNGDRFSARDLAKMYHEGAGVAKDPKQVVAWLVKAAELGHPEAQANVALLMVQGKELPKDVPTAQRLAMQSAEQRHGPGWTLLGDFYSDGTLPKDFPRALEAYRNGASLGDARARAALTPELLRSAALVPAEAQKDQAGAALGESAAMVRVADRLVDGIGLPKSLPQALEWYERAAEMGDRVAQGMAGLLLVTGQAGRKDPAKGVRWVKAAAEAGDPSAMISMGDLHDGGAFGPANAKALARQWYEKARAARHSAAEERLAGL